MFCRSSFFLLYLFFGLLCCLSFFDLRILITTLVSSNTSCSFALFLLAIVLSVLLIRILITPLVSSNSSFSYFHDKKKFTSKTCQIRTLHLNLTKQKSGCNHLPEIIYGHCGVMIRVIPSSAVYHGLYTWSDQIKDNMNWYLPFSPQ